MYFGNLLFKKTTEEVTISEQVQGPVKYITKSAVPNSRADEIFVKYQSSFGKNSSATDHTFAKMQI